MKHTKGPWIMNEVTGMEVIAISEEGYMTHAQVFKRGVGNRYLTDEDRANAHLIAAAPAMLEMLNKIYERITDNDAHAVLGHDFCETVGNMIAKAEGRE